MLKSKYVDKVKTSTVKKAEILFNEISDSEKSFQEPKMQRRCQCRATRR